MEAMRKVGPHRFQFDESGTVWRKHQTTGGLVQVGITASGDAMCRATQTSFRMDADTAA